MRFVSCAIDGRPHAALLRGEHVVPLRGISALGAETPVEVLAEPVLDERLARPFDAVQPAPVVPRPGKIFCLGLNYRAHVDETGRELPEYPVLFTKFAESLIANGDPILLPPESEQVDYEAELALVVGRPLRRWRGDSVDGVLAGYSVANDVTMRDYQYRTHQWLQGKTWERSTPLGPALVTPEEVGDPGALAISLRLNGSELQRSDTSRLIFDLPAILAHLSEFVTLMPGDVILTGTPGGVGFRRDPQVFLRPGDRVEVEIEGVGTLANPVAAEEPAA
jgi:acylpyruvate hydrolase